jgi:hypothetical protein
MKQSKYISTCILLAGLFTTKVSSSQNIPINEPNRNKPLMFANKPSTSNCNTDSINALFSYNKSQVVRINLTNDLFFQGKVISKVILDSARISMVVTSQNYAGYILSLSRRILSNGLVSITGRLINTQYGDCYELVTSGNKQLLLKKNYYDLINE